MAYKNPILNFADEHPIIFCILGLPLLFDIPSMILGKGYRQAKYGDYKLGAAAVLSEEDEQQFFNVGTNKPDMTLFGSLTGEKIRNQAPPLDSGYYKGDVYRDTTHLNTKHASAPGGREVHGGDPMYTDTRSLTPVMPSSHAYDRGFLDKPGTAMNPVTARGRNPIQRPADPRLVELVGGNSVFAGLNGIRRL